MVRIKSFNPRTHTGCDAARLVLVTVFILFQSTHPHGVRREIQTLEQFDTSFNPRTHTGCDPVVSEPNNFATGFNPRTHTGCDVPIPLIFRAYLYVSIHAPTRGATSSAIIGIPRPVFQSTHPHGVRPVLLCNRFRCTLFQSTHPHGVRHDSHQRKHDDIEVSIHAPTRGATYQYFRFSLKSRFQSTHPHGVRQVKL